MGKFSRSKGKRAELEFAHWITEKWNLPARRGQQFHGGPESPDVVISRLNGVHLEVKRTERFEIHKAMEQAIAESKPGEVALVAHRRNRGDWLFVLKGADAVSFARCLLAAIDGGTDGDPP